MDTEIVNKTIVNGAEYIAKQLQVDGGFISYSSAKKETFISAISYRTNFITSLVLEVLCNLDDSIVLQKTKKNAVTYLLSQKSKQWSWNYWSKSSKEFLQMPYPDDLDDTFCALNAISLYDKKLLTGSAYAHILHLLTSTEKKEGGPYKTWYIDKKRAKNWNDIDIVVNSNIAYFLSLQEITLPNMQKYLTQKLSKRELHSQYYPTFYPVLYFLSRITNLDKKEIVPIILESENNKTFWGNPLNTSLAILALLNCNYPPEKLEKAIAYLIKTQKNSHWKAYAFCIDPARNKKIYYAGSPALTTAYCIFAVSLYQKRIREIQSNKGNSATIIKEKLHKILSSKHLTFKDQELALAGAALIKKIVNNDISKQIPLMPYFFNESLDVKKEKIEDNKIILLGVANVLGWLAYTVYDDFLDEEGSPKFLPLANICLRKLTRIYDNSFKKFPAITNLFHAILDSIEVANFWEVTHCRFPVTKDSLQIHTSKLPDFGNLNQLANKSLGHSLGPMTILLLKGYKKDTKEFTALSNFFKHYLIAKQLNDDIHDWEEDLKKGHITFVSSLILKKAIKRKLINNNVIFKNDLIKLQKLFWYEIIEDICSIINNHVEIAQNELDACSLIVNKQVLDNLLVIYKKAADKALEESNKTKDFLKVYK